MILILTILMNSPAFFSFYVRIPWQPDINLLSEILASQASAFVKCQFEFYI